MLIKHYFAGVPEEGIDYFPDPRPSPAQYHNEVASMRRHFATPSEVANADLIASGLINQDYIDVGNRQRLFLLEHLDGFLHDYPGKHMLLDRHGVVGVFDTNEETQIPGDAPMYKLDFPLLPKSYNGRR